MTNIWHSFIWYVAGAFVLVGVTAKYVLLSAESAKTNDFIIYLFCSLGFILSMLYLFLISKNWQNRMIRWHILFILFVVVNQLVMSLVQILVVDHIFINAFPFLFSFQVLLFCLTFISEVHYREQLLKIK